jgi:hypothetical protein
VGDCGARSVLYAPPFGDCESVRVVLVVDEEDKKIKVIAAAAVIVVFLMLKESVRYTPPR